MKVTFYFPTALDKLQVRQPKRGPQGIYSRVSEPLEKYGKEYTIYEAKYDFSHVLPEDPVVIENEILATSTDSTRVPIKVNIKTDLLSVWILFPTDKPYKSYSLVSYPVDRSAPPSIMQRRYVIDHPYGQLIGWSVVNPDPNRIYECRWTY